MKQLSPFARKVLDFMNPDPEKQQEILTDPALAPVSTSSGMQAFVCRIEQAVQKGEKILIAGDYDADGVLATTIMVDGLRKLGLECGFYIPNRIREGYGLKPKIVQIAAMKGYSLIITVDNGVRALEALKEARKEGIDVIVTDHHTLEGDLDVEVLVHPSLMESPFYALCGAGIAYECMRALGVASDQQLMFAAVASIADCMEVFGETRALIVQGLGLLNEQGEMHLNPLSKSGLKNESTVAFQIAPRINAVGRLANLVHANNLVRYFLDSRPEQVYSFARRMEEINQQRRNMTESIVAKANALVQVTRPVLCVCDYSFHEGIIGLAAGQLCSHYNKPVILGAHSHEGIKCSMRAPQGFACLDFLSGFEDFVALGGHALAAGFTVPYEKWESFNDYIFHKGLEVGFVSLPKKAMPIEVEDITLENIESLDDLRPFGTGFELPRFELNQPYIERIFDLSGGRHRKFSLAGGIQAIHFNQSPQDRAASVLSIRKMRGSLEIHEYQGRKIPNFIIDEIEYF